MSELTARDRELVALGAAVGSNCVPCVEYHIPQSRNAGLTDPEIQSAIQQADQVRQVPARKVLATALGLLPCASGEAATTAPAEGCGCGAPAAPAGAPAGHAAQPSDGMMKEMKEMMSKMMSTCVSQGQAAYAANATAKQPATAAAAREECGCS